MSNKILIVDDSYAVRSLVTMTLKFQGYEVIAAENGQEALDKLEQHDHVDAIFLDLLMPIMGGFECLSHIRANHKYKDLPIVILTTEGQKENEKKGLELGASHYLVKPFEPFELLSTVEGLFKKKAA